MKEKIQQILRYGAFLDTRKFISPFWFVVDGKFAAMVRPTPMRHLSKLLAASLPNLSKTSSSINKQQRRTSSNLPWITSLTTTSSFARKTFSPTRRKPNKSSIGSRLLRSFGRLCNNKCRASPSRTPASWGILMWWDSISSPLPGTGTLSAIHAFRNLLR
jgi:hypothetical protein